MTKNEIRKDILNRRLSLGDRELSEKSGEICRRIVSDDLFMKASQIGLYWPFKKEVLTQPVFWAALANRKKVGLPLVDVDRRSISYLAVSGPAVLRPGPYGIMEPPFDRERIIPADALDLIIVPGVAFDGRGYRIGYGGGYFDRFLADEGVTAKLAAAAFDLQIIDRVPDEEHDRTVDVIFTESRVIRCFSKKPA